MKTRIAILYDKPLDVGGVETHLRSIFRCADPEHFEFFIIAPEAPAFRQEINTGAVQFYPFDGWWPLRWKNYRTLAGIIAEQDIELVHPHSSTAAILGRWVAKRMKLPVVDTIHLPVTQYHGKLQTLRARAGRRIFIEIDRWLNFHATDQFVFVSQSDRDRCIQEGLAPAAQSTVIPNGIDLAPFQILRDQAGLRKQFNVPSGASVFTFIGRLDHQKGLAVLLAAFAGLTTTKPQPILWLIGDGPLRIELEEMVKQLNLEPRVIFWGYQSPVINHLFASDFFVLPSIYEAMPITLLEALAAGLPCIATDVGDNRLIIEPEVNGLIVPPGDSNSLQLALQRLLDESGQRKKMKVNNLLKINNFSERLMVEKLQIIYNNLVTGKPRKII